MPISITPRPIMRTIWSKKRISTPRTRPGIDVPFGRDALYHRALRTGSPANWTTMKTSRWTASRNCSWRRGTATSRTSNREPEKSRPSCCLSYFNYVRNLALIERRMTPDLYTLVIAAQQTAGRSVCDYLDGDRPQLPLHRARCPFPVFKMGLGQGRLAGWRRGRSSRTACPASPASGGPANFNRARPKIKQEEWSSGWNPFGQCSWPPEDQSIEKFRTHVKDVAMALLGQ